MQSEFEKKIQLTMEEFALAPNDAVWQKVELRISQEKKRRRIIFYWVAALILIAAGGGLWLVSPKLKSEMAGNITTANDKTNAENASQRIDKKKSAVEQENKTASKQTVTLLPPGKLEGAENNGKDLSKGDIDNTIAAQKKPSDQSVEKSSTGTGVKGDRELVSAKETPIKKKQRGIELKRIPEQLTASSKVAFEKEEALNHSLNRKEVKDEAASNIEDITTTDSKDEIAKTEVDPAAKAIDTAIVLAAPTNSIGETEPTAIKLDSRVAATASMEKKKTPSTKSKKLRWGLTVYSGISNNRSGFPLLSNKSYNDALFSSPQNGTGSNPGSNANVPVKFDYNSSFSYGLGGFVQKPVSKRLSLTAGVNYHYLSATTLTGSKVNTRRSLYDSILNTRNNLDAFYTFSSLSNGQLQLLTRFTNKYHLLQLPVNVQWQLNSIRKRPLLLTAGITPGFVIGTKALYYNRLAQITYVDKNQFKNFQLATQAGLMFTISSKNKYSINLGPHIMYGVTNLAKSATQTSQHLFFSGLKSNITFNRK